MSTLATGDAFAATLDTLKQTLQSFGPMVPTVDAVTTLITDTDTLLNDIGSLISAADDIDDALMALGEVLEFLEPIPIVGEVAGLMSTGIETVSEAFKDALTTAKEINTETIQPVAKTLGDVQAGLSDFRTVVVDVSQKIPGYINTIEILSYLSQIAAPLAPVLVGTEASDKLLALMNTFNSVQQDLGHALNALNPVIAAAQTAVHDLSGVLSSIQQAVGGGVGSALTDIKSAADALAPLNSGFHRMEEAIKPLAWVLDALACIFDKILKPVIDLIMQATGLDTLVQSAETAIFNKLGIGPIMDAAKSGINQPGISQAGDATGSAQGDKSHRLWDAAETALGQYRSGQDGGTKAAILGLISAITNTPIDPNKPSVAPPFPVATPAITPAAPATNGGPGASAAFYLSRPLAQVDSRVLMALKSPAVRPHTLSLAALAIAQGASPNLLPPVDPSVWPNTAAFITSCGTLVTNLDALAPAATKLEGALLSFTASLALPATFAQQVNDLSQLLADAVHILDFLATLNVGFVTALVKPFDDVARDQNGKMGAVTNALPALQAALAALEAASQSVVRSVPQTVVVDQAIHRVEGWSMSMNQLIQLVEQGKAEDARQGGKQTAQIAAFAAKLEGIATAVSVKLANMAAEAQTLATAINGIQGGIDTYAIQMDSITSHSTLLSNKALPVAGQAVHILGIVNSIVDPLAGLLQSQNCVDAGSPMKSYAADGRDAINSVGQAAATAQPQAFEDFAENLAESVLPLTDLAAAVQAASASISTTSVQAFQSHSNNLETGLANLALELTQSASYTATIQTRQGGTQTITVSNALFTQDLLTEAKQIVSALAPQATPA
ncbi:hypothetical protein [Hymenobacter arizonensis]|uniref:Uncharacterized protein n=1 Tax=Hymenobacter arizonensis TaxID=1227077 RepID=A0A1I6BFM2_HYMAR|nr:hypothetical protein [Hymenobacter arizonensis]SFQ79706.1 hypothetical protein SAMN04515668_4484 [Hymenobacter arizonensis]